MQREHGAIGRVERADRIGRDELSPVVVILARLRDSGGHGFSERGEDAHFSRHGEAAPGAAAAWERRAMSARDVRPEDLHADLLDLEPVAGEPAAPSRGRRELLLATLRPATLFEGFVERLAGFLDLPLARARDLARAVPGVARGDWVDDQVAGVRLFHFAGGPRHASADCGIVHVASARAIPATCTSATSGRSCSRTVFASRSPPSLPSC